jgi:hypothetical protein
VLVTVYFDATDIGSDLSFLQKAGSLARQGGQGTAGVGRVGSVDFVLRSSSTVNPTDGLASLAKKYPVLSQNAR